MYAIRYGKYPYCSQNREIATIIGGIEGMCFLIVERMFRPISSEIIRELILSITLIPIIYLSVVLKQQKGTFLMCVVFLCVTVTHNTDTSPLAFAINRIVDTSLGISVFLYGKMFENIIIMRIIENKI